MALFFYVSLHCLSFGTSFLNYFGKRNDADVYFIVIVENGVRLRLNIVDTPGYGDQVNNEGWCVLISLCYSRLFSVGIRTHSWDPIIKYIKDQHSAYLRKELTAMRDRYIQDTRIHCCLYFINPTGHALRPIDVIVMKKLSEVVNVVPVIAKSDSLTLEERERFKFKVCHSNITCLFLFLFLCLQIREELIFNNIRLYPFDTDEDDEEEVLLNEGIRVSLFSYYLCIFIKSLFGSKLSPSLLLARRAT